MDPATFETLLSPVGAALMETVAELSDQLDQLGLGTRLRHEHPAELVAAAVGQHELRRHAVKKFGEDALSMWFTRDALEQSTRGPVAAHRANRMRELGVETVVDLGCGIGGDLIAMARVGIRVRGVELDPVRAAMARANLAALGLEGQVEVGDVETTQIGPDETPFLDPARRDGRGRVFTLGGLSPSWEKVSELLAGRAVAKMMPGIAHTDVPAGVEAEWVSDTGDLVEAALWGAGFATGVDRRATLLPAGVELVNQNTPATVGPVLTHLVEPDDAVIRAGLVADFAALADGTLIDPKIAWVTSDSPPNGTSAGFGNWFRVIEELPFHTKQLRAALRERDVGPLTVKTRGVQVVPEQLVTQLKLRGSVPATLVMTRVTDTGKAFLVEPLGSGSPTALVSAHERARRPERGPR